MSLEAGNWQDLFDLLAAMIPCVDRFVHNGAAHGMIHGAVWYRMSNEIETNWDLFHSLPWRPDVAHGVGHGMIYKHYQRQTGTAFCPCCPAPIFHDMKPLLSALDECKDSPQLNMKYGCAFGVWHAHSQYSDYLFDTPNPFHTCDAPFAAWCFEQWFAQGYFMNTTFSSAITKMNFGRLLKAAEKSQFITGICLPESEYMHTAGRTPHQMSQACIWGMSAKLFPVFTYIMQVGSIGERCSICEKVRLVQDNSVAFEGYLCPVMVDALTQDILDRAASHSNLYTWCSLFVDEHTPDDLRDQRWLTCLHGAFYWMPAFLGSKTYCDDDIKSVSPYVAEMCEKIHAHPWSDVSFQILETLDAM